MALEKSINVNGDKENLSPDNYRGLRQKAALGLETSFAEARWTHVRFSSGNKKNEKVFILYSIGKEDIKNKLDQFTGLKNNGFDQLADFILLIKVGEESINISQAIIYIREAENRDKSVKYLVKRLNEVEKSKNRSWIFKKNESIIINKRESRMVPNDLLEIIRNSLFEF